MILDQILNVKQKLTSPILIIGHTGFKGTWLSLLLEKLDIQVIGLSLPADEDSLYIKLDRLGSVEEYFHDIRDYSYVQEIINRINPKYIFHLAAQPLVLSSYKDPRKTFETNIMGTANILESALKSGNCERIIVSTTDKVYKNSDISQRFSEDSSLGGKDPYSWSKVGTEAAIGAWRQISKIEHGPEIISARAGNVIGGGDQALNRLLPDLIKSFISDSKILIRNPQSTRPWQHVLDPLWGYVLAMTTDTGLPAFNFAPDGKSLSVGDVTNIAINEWGTRTSIEILENKDDYESKNLELDSNLAKVKLNWVNHWSQENAVISTVKWWKLVHENKLTFSEACNLNLGELLGK